MKSLSIAARLSRSFRCEISSKPERLLTNSLYKPIRRAMNQRRTKTRCFSLCNLWIAFILQCPAAAGSPAANAGRNRAQPGKCRNDLPTASPGHSLCNAM